MFDVAYSLNGALQGAREALSRAALLTARSQTRPGSGRTDAAMAGVAQCTIFTEALLNAMHARLAEIKSVAKP